jgi:hypothetical protein
MLAGLESVYSVSIPFFLIFRLTYRAVENDDEFGQPREKHWAVSEPTLVFTV